jgi:two-component system, sensor histidine kinase and response regulator
MESMKGVSQPPKVDLAELLLRVDNDRELLRDLLGIFKEDFPRHLEDLRKGVANRDVKAVKVVSHTLKGMLSNLAVAKATASAAHLEQLAGAGGTDALGDGLVEFEKNVDGLLAEMESYMAEVQS